MKATARPRHGVVPARLAGAAHNTMKAIIWTCNGGSNQQWTLN